MRESLTWRIGNKVNNAKRNLVGVASKISKLNIDNVDILRFSKQKAIKESERLVEHAILNKNKTPSTTSTTLGNCSWYDERLSAIVTAYGLRAEDILKIFDVFHSMDYSGCNELDIDDFFEFIQEPRSIYGMWLFEMIDSTSNTVISFSEYVQIVVIYSMFGKEEIFRLIFSSFDTRKRTFLDQSQWEELVEVMTSQESIKHAKLTAIKSFEKHSFMGDEHKSEDPTGILLYEEFSQILDLFPFLSFPLYRLQLKIRIKNLGESFWKEKKQ
eukprot:CAMPEP_0195510114 /NCGR_PEP_ID=MMETSP0794_2-20130614/2861_1 /TAXON_ID=515487 /ORGANISM="Stephanopyxis turris, Strain CCMP 815" /LENGTH=270 /DNA_ID=CAMNT_0040637481 /DNA_START=727 /DNA_END=1536 /DNA_ORIENTATION=-